MSYDRQIPDVPIALSMLPRATTLTLDDLLYLVQPGNNMGERSKSLTLAVLAAFLGNKHFSSIVLEGTGGKELTLSGDGVTYVIPPGSGATDQFEFEVSDDKNVTIKMSGPDGVRVVTLTPTSVEVKNTQAGLEHKTTIGNTGITVLSQSRDGANIVETTSELHAEFLKLIRGQKTAQIGTKIVENNIVVIINEIVELAKNLIVKGLLKIEGNAQFDSDVGITGALNVDGTVRSEAGFSGGISGRAGESANFPLIRADQILPRTNGSRISINGDNINLSGVLSGLFSGAFTGSWIPGESVCFNYAMDVVNPVEQMQDLPDGTVGIFYNKNSSATYIIQWWDMDHTQRTKTVDSGTPFVFMKKKNSSNQECGLLLSVGEA